MPRCGSPRSGEEAETSLDAEGSGTRLSGNRFSSDRGCGGGVGTGAWDGARDPGPGGGAIADPAPADVQTPTMAGAGAGTGAGPPVRARSRMRACPPPPPPPPVSPTPTRAQARTVRVLGTGRSQWVASRLDRSLARSIAACIGGPRILCRVRRLHQGNEPPSEERTS